MNYEKFCEILNRHIFEGEKKELLRKLAERPERFIGLFRPTKPGAKILQHLLQSHEIRFGDAMEELISEFLKDWDFTILSKIIVPDPSNPRNTLDIDQYFTDGETHYFIEQKVRDDHDSTKKRGQIRNFETKLEYLYKKHGTKLVGIMYFIDPDLKKNKHFYLKELRKMENIYGTELHLFYGKELFEFFDHPKMWETLLEWLKKWKESLPELPEINFDAKPEESFREIKDLEIQSWRRIINNKKLWEEGIIKAIFREGKTLLMIIDFFNTSDNFAYRRIAKLLENRVEEFY